ncbi:unnamed protein product [Diplocarpon coronariae]
MEVLVLLYPTAPCGPGAMQTPLWRPGCCLFGVAVGLTARKRAYAELTGLAPHCSELLTSSLIDCFA